jgi:hypothetical protein
MKANVVILGVALAACGHADELPDGASPGDGALAAGDLAGVDLAGADLAGAPVGGLADKYPGDVGIGADPAVIWAESFEEGSVGAVAARYDQVRSTGMSLVADRPAKSGGAAALALKAGGANPATDLFKQIPPQEELYARWYVKYAASVPWHHSGVWIGGANPSTSYPNPQAGLRPTGADRFSVSLEPVYGVDTSTPRFDFYNYWSAMHSWMASVTNDGTSYYGNALVHRNDFTVDPGQWVCLEVHVRLNPSAAASSGAVLEAWKNDVLMQRFDDAGPKGYWIRDKFCPQGADGKECTDYPAAFDSTLDLRFRTDGALKITSFWPQNYITDAAEGTMTLDDVVLAKTRVGCLR